MKFLAEFPSTNARIFVTICLAVGYVVAAITASWRGHPLSDGTLYGVGAFLTVWAGLDVTQFAVKRNTYAPSPPSPPDVEDRAASPSSTSPGEGKASPPDVDVGKELDARYGSGAGVPQRPGGE